MIRIGGLLVLYFCCSPALAADCDLPSIAPMTIANVRECLDWLRIELRQTQLRAEAEQHRLAEQIAVLKTWNIVVRTQICSMSLDIAQLGKETKILYAMEKCAK